MVGLAVKVPLALDRAVILSCAIVQLYANPFSRRKPRCSQESHNRLSSIVELDRLSHTQRQTCHC